MGYYLDRQIDNRQRQRQIDREKVRQIEKNRDRQRNNRQIEKKIDRYSKRQIYREKDL